MFRLEFTVNENTKRKCSVCDQAIERGKLTVLMLVTLHGVSYEASYHYSCVETERDKFINDGNYPQRFSKLQERIASGGRIFG